MKKYILSYILIILFGCCVLHAWDKDTVYKNYCLKGKKGYQILSAKVGSVYSEMKSFWKTFALVIMSFDKNERSEDILTCNPFWIHYQQDVFFDLADDETKVEKMLIIELFEKAVKRYWAKIVKRMAGLENVHVTPAKVEQLTQRRIYAEKLRNYQKFYDQLDPMPIPGDLRSAKNLGSCFLSLLNTVGRDKVEERHKRAVPGYLNAWKKYYSIPIPPGPGKYNLKAAAYEKKRLKLLEIEGLAEIIDLFQIAGHFRKIRNEKEKNKKLANSYTSQHGLDTRINKIYNKPLLLWQDLSYARDKIVSEAGNIGHLETELKKKVDWFRKIPRYNDLEGLENYYTKYKDSNDKIARSLNGEFKELLLNTIEKQWQNGAEDKNALIRFGGAVNKYNEYFGATSYDKCVDFLSSYYRLLQNNKIPELYRHVKNHSLSEDDFEHMKRKWAIQTPEELNNKYIGTSSSAATNSGSNLYYKQLVKVWNLAKDLYPNEAELINHTKVHLKFVPEKASVVEKIMLYKKKSDYCASDEIPAFFYMLADLLAWTRNEYKQLDLLKEIKEATKDKYSLTLPNGDHVSKLDIDTLIKNIENFLKVIEYHKKTSSFKESELDGRTKDEKFEKLTPGQQARMHYMVSDLYILKGNNFIPSCHHLFKCYSTMGNHSIEELRLYRKGKTVKKSTVKKKLAYHFAKLPNEKKWKRKFRSVLKKKYKYGKREAETEYESIRKLLRGAGSSPPAGTEAGSEERVIIKFLKEVKTYMTKGGKLEGEYKEIIFKLFDPQIGPPLPMSEINEYIRKNRLPEGFNYEIYTLLWNCYFQKNKDEAFDILSEVSKNDQEVAEALNEIYVKAFRHL